MKNAELRRMSNKLARLIVLSKTIPAQLLSNAQCLYHELEMEASRTAAKKICAMCARKDEELEGNKYFSYRQRDAISNEFSGADETVVARGRGHRANLPQNQ